MVPGIQAVTKIWEIDSKFVYRGYTNWWEIPSKSWVPDTRDRVFETHGQSEDVLIGLSCFDPLSGLLATPLDAL